MTNQRMCVILPAIAAWCCLLSPQAFALTPREIYQKVSPGVVFILAVEGSQVGRGGTGSIIREEGLVITNAHIFAQADSSKPLSDVFVFLKPEKVTGSHPLDLSRRYQGKIVAYDLPLDLALVQITNVDVPLTTVEVGDSDRVAIGDQAYAIGHPEQGGLWSLTTGVISAQRQDFGGVIGKHLFQTEASINRGNSGGPLLDESGTMIGVNSLIARKARDGMVITDVNFSIKSNVVLKWLSRLGYRFAAAGSVPSRKEEKRVVIASPPKESPAGQSAGSEPLERESMGEGKKASEEFMGLESEEKARCDRDKEQEKRVQEGEILTEKNPYDMDELIAGMQEMEDLMEEMRGKIERYKKRRDL